MAELWNDGKPRSFAARVVHADDAGHRRCLTDIDRHEIGVGDGRPDKPTCSISGLDEVVDVLALAREQRRVFQAQDRVPRIEPDLPWSKVSLVRRRTVR